MTLLKDNRSQPDFFVPDMFDNLSASFKDDIATMEHPIFVLSKKTDMRCLEYKKDDVRISITPSVLGLPTIFDKDVLLYCGSLLMTEINAGRTPPKTLRVSTHDLLHSTNRLTNGLAYERLQNALKRLRGVSITTNIRTNRREVTKGFGLIDSYEVIESSRVKDRMIRLEITLSDWLYNSILGKEVLTINRDYFRLGKPMERRLYEIARKFCGNQKSWSINLVNLMDKTGSTGTLRLFRSRIKIIIKDDHLPDYSIAMDDNDKVTFRRTTNSLNDTPLLDYGQLANIKADTVKLARTLVSDAGTGWAFDAVISEFSKHMEKKGNPDDINGALIGFVKKKVASAP